MPPLWVLLPLVYVYGVVHGMCPDIVPLEPCVCRTIVDKSEEDFTILRCHHLESEASLVAVIEATKHLPLYELELVDCTFEFLPYDAFVNTSFQILSLQNSSLTSLSNSALIGLNDHLRLLEILHCTFATPWSWHLLGHLHNLLEVQVSDTNLPDITRGMSEVHHLSTTSFLFRKNGITYLEDGVFAHFPNVMQVSVGNNRISTLKRSMFPRPAPRLHILGLSYNRLEDLPSDLFTDMPALKSLYLAGNPLHTINEDIYKPIWNQLNLFLFSETQLSCDCRLTWILNQDNRDKFMNAECMRPEAFHGRHLHSLNAHELWC